MSKYAKYGVYYDLHTEQHVTLAEKISNTECWIADPLTEKEQPYIIVFESELKEVN